MKLKLKWPASSSISPLWYDDDRVESSKSFISDNVLNSLLCKRRQATPLLQSDNITNPSGNYNPQSIPTPKKNEKDDTSLRDMTFPMIIVRKDLKNLSSKRMKAKKRTPFLGFDIIFPSGFGSAVWRAFQFAGARAIGVDELHSIQLDYGVLSFPR